MKPLKKSISITLDADIIEKTRTLAEESDRSFSQYVNILLKKHIEAKENKQKNEDAE
ncbi:MAG: toxin-antitoxin system protein [Clostridia bacterium]|nr:toxin-antitoxin system protein [Clostridia bacterium]